MGGCFYFPANMSCHFKEFLLEQKKAGTIPLSRQGGVSDTHPVPGTPVVLGVARHCNSWFILASLWSEIEKGSQQHFPVLIVKVASVFYQ